MLKSTEQHKRYWAERQIDWKTSYFDTHDHPHRELIVRLLKTIPFKSLLEVGCASGPNLYKIRQNFPHAELGGVDVSEAAVHEGRKHLPGVSLEVGSADDIFFSDKSTDVLLTDMALIYVGPMNIDKSIKEIKRVTRSYAMFVEFHSESWLKRTALRFASGYNAYDYKKLLSKHGFYDIRTIKIPEEAWPGGEPQKTFGYIITARI